MARSGSIPFGIEEFPPKKILIRKGWCLSGRMWDTPEPAKLQARRFYACGKPGEDATSFNCDLPDLLLYSAGAGPNLKRSEASKPGQIIFAKWRNNVGHSLGKPAGTGDLMEGKRARQRVSFLRRVPKARAWIDAGFEIQIAMKLLAAGFPSVESIGELSREQFLAKRGLGTGTLAKCEALLGRPLRSLAAYWTEQGLALGAAEALGRVGVDSAEALGRLTREELRAAGVRDDQLEDCEALLERAIPEAVEQPTASESFLVAAIVPELEAAFGQLLTSLAMLQSKRSTLGAEEERLRLSLVNAAAALDAFLSAPPTGLNLTSQSAETESAIHAYLIRTRFSARLLDGDGNIHIPPHSAEDCELAVYFQHGRWFATWIKPEVDPGRPETSRRELLRFGTDRAGRLMATKV